MKLNITRPAQVEAKTLSIYCKVCDSFSANIKDADGKDLGGQDDGYVPDFMPDTGGGDYLNLEIDIDTGVVTNWRKPTAEQLEAFISGKDSE